MWLIIKIFWPQIGLIGQDFFSHSKSLHSLGVKMRNGKKNRDCEDLEDIIKFWSSYSYITCLYMYNIHHILCNCKTIVLYTIMRKGTRKLLELVSDLFVHWIHTIRDCDPFAWAPGKDIVTYLERIIHARKNCTLSLVYITKICLFYWPSWSFMKEFPRIFTPFKLAGIVCA